MLNEPLVKCIHEKSSPTKIAHAITEEKAKMPAAIGRSRVRNAWPIAYRITRIRSAQPVAAPRPVYCVER